MEAIEAAWAERSATCAEELERRRIHDDLMVDIGTTHSRSVREAASWSLAAEMVRRHPGRFLLATSSPMEGLTYDCLRLCRLDIGSWAEINRFATGSAQRWNSAAPNDRPVWFGLLTEWMDTDDRRAMVASVEAWLELPSSLPCPPAPRRDLTYRVIAGFLTAKAFEQERWGVRGLRDASGLSIDEDVASLFGLRPHIPGTIPVAELPDLPEANLWAICRGGSPVASVTTDAVLTPIGGEPIDLMKARRGPDGIASAVAAMARVLA